MKNLVISLGAGIVLLGVLIAAIMLDFFPRPVLEIRNDTGRFVIHQLGNARRDQYVLDTRTGRIWQFGEDQEKQSFLIPVPYNKLDGSRSYTAPAIRNSSDGERTKLNIRLDEPGKVQSGTPSYIPEKK